MADYAGRLPVATPESKPYWDGLKEHKLMLPTCDDCGPHFYPRPFCPTPNCFNWDIKWTEASGKGKVYTYVISHQPIPPYGADNPPPYIIAIVELDEGPRMMTNLIVDDPYGGEDLRGHQAHWVGSDVEIVFDDVTDEVTLPKFKLV